MTKKIITESRNFASEQIDTLSTLEIAQLINQEDQKVAEAVATQLSQIANTIDLIAQAFAQHGRLIYVGAGTSGRLGILDASECPPTYGTSSDQVVACIAGGKEAMFQAVENAEDNEALGREDLHGLHITEQDIVVGIAASGRTPYVIGAMNYAKQCGAKVVALVCNPDSQMSDCADIVIAPLVGSEVITGSSRMKAGTAQKLVLNMLTTGAMIRSGKVFGNLMVDVKASNQKLRQRQLSMVKDATGVDEQTALSALEDSGHHCKTAILMLLTGSDAATAKEVLRQHKGFLRPAIQALQCYDPR